MDIVQHLSFIVRPYVCTDNKTTTKHKHYHADHHRRYWLVYLFASKHSPAEERRLGTNLSFTLLFIHVCAADVVRQTNLTFRRWVDLAYSSTSIPLSTQSSLRVQPLPFGGCPLGELLPTSLSTLPYTMLPTRADSKGRCVTRNRVFFAFHVTKLIAMVRTLFWSTNAIR
jgi:hypothetical protein